MKKLSRTLRMSLLVFLYTERKIMFKRSSFVKAFSATLVSSVLVLTGALSATASTTNSALDPALVEEVTSVWTTHGVTPEDQEALLEKMSTGVALDSMSGAAPQNVEEVSSETNITQVQRFDDGSINVLTMEKPDESQTSPDDVTTMGVSGCSQTGFRYNNCLIDGWFTAVQLAFRATYVLGTSAAQLISYNTPVVQCFPGINCGGPFFSLVRMKQSGTNAAQVSLGTTWNYIGIGGGSTTYLHLYVRDQSAWTN